MIGLLRRLEAAMEAFCTNPEAIRPGITGVLRKSTQSIEQKLRPADRDYLSEQALGLMDPDVRGWLIVTIRQHGKHADIDADIHIPAGVDVGVETVLSEVLS